MTTTSELKAFWKTSRKELLKALENFRKAGESGNGEKIFSEMVYCLLTPQSKALLCWEAVKKLRKKNLFFSGSASRVKPCLRGVRFPNNKSAYITEARKTFPVVIKKLETEKSIFNLRAFLVKNIKGYGFKEASHFLRNIGKGEKLAILDRHILRNLKDFGVIKEIPAAVSTKLYLEIEKKFMLFAEYLKIPPAELDLLLWYKEAGRIFK
ncbi:MAG: N-glycosylase/DNA lyase [Elusimicrobiota bacterium]|nr:N-glycosylase/DNA lyase [Elusimicrobiota bacterium]